MSIIMGGRCTIKPAPCHCSEDIWWSLDGGALHIMQNTAYPTELFAPTCSPRTTVHSSRHGRTMTSGTARAIAVGNKNATIISGQDRKSTRLNSSHVAISYAVFCL